VAALLLCAVAVNVHAQGLRFGNHREIAPPKYALLRIGPFYSNVTYLQQAGFRYVSTRGTGGDYLFGSRRGGFKEDGSELPLVSTLSFRNYLIVTRNMDVDLSLRVQYEFYPLDTQENDFHMDLSDEQIAGNFSTEFRITPFIRGNVYARIVYKPEYVDIRGETDRYGGRRMEYFSNSIGTDVDWLLAKKQNLGLSLSRLDFIPISDDFDEQQRVAYREQLTYEYQIWDGLIAGARFGAHQVLYDDPERTDINLMDWSLFARYGEGVEEGVQVRLTTASTLELRLGYSTGYNISSRRENETDLPQTLTGAAVLKTQLSKQWSHTLSYRRNVRTGFLTSTEIADRYRYALQWSGLVAKANAFIQSSDVLVNATDIPDYGSWSSGATLKYPLTQVVTLNLNTTYAVRDNKDPATDVPLAPEMDGEYATWTTYVGTGFQLTKKATFNTYYQHVERDGDIDDLDYSRDIVAANVTFRHEF